MAVKQLGSVDPVPHGTIDFVQRFACVLVPNQRCGPGAWHMLACTARTGARPKTNWRNTNSVAKTL